MNGNGDDNNYQWVAEIEAMKKEIAVLRSGKIASDTKEKMDNVMVIGGLREHKSVEDAWWWMSDELWKSYGPQPCVVYSKENFKSIAYASFQNKVERDAAIQIFEGLTKGGDGGSVWAKIDKELMPRILSSFLGGLRWHLGEWGYRKNSYSFHEDTWTFHALNQPVLQASLKNGQLVIEWKNEEWGNWNELQNSDEFKNLVKNANDKWSKVARKGKGKTKDTTR